MVAIVKLLIMDVPKFGYGKIITIEIGILANFSLVSNHNWEFLKLQLSTLH